MITMGGNYLEFPTLTIVYTALPQPFRISSYAFQTKDITSPSSGCPGLRGFRKQSFSEVSANGNRCSVYAKYVYTGV